MSQNVQGCMYGKSRLDLVFEVKVGFGKAEKRDIWVQWKMPASLHRSLEANRGSGE